ncbi:glycoside hydrolase family 44 protein [Hymenobacter negativus]|uniref:Glycoside hydrolase family 44 catalytic domain-containing protein n=1 Tax=Hymenobacter negativus TaxID=2795026 RepID=A0ABS3QLC8_9BACT|nr:glycoside hydrolase family 44 protein [Hymenobacter negativus]MBO2011485.1 hypothetical protein [Hymenobacter negativus]
MKNLCTTAAAWLGLALPVAAQLPVTFTISTAAANRQAISPLIYGTNQPQQPADNYGSVRLGGNRTTGYNWENNASNAGQDYIHQSDDYLCYTAGLSNAGCAVPGQVVKSFVQSVQALPGSPAALPTLQMAGYVAADKNNTSVSVAETAPSARWKPVVARKPGGVFAYPPNLTDNAVYMDEEVHFLTSTFGTAANGGVKGYFLDNEPALWTSTHPRIHPTAVGAAELWLKSRDLAAAVKDVDPSAEVFGGVFYGFAEYLNEQDAPDWASEGAGYPWYVDYYLAKMRGASTTAGRRLLDVLDVHWYPEATGLDNGNPVRITGDNVSSAVQQARLQAPRSLWQAGYRETSWIAQYFSQFLPLLPSLQNSINTRYPGTKLSISEYCYGGCGDISGGLAQADVLGIFGKNGVYNADWWDDCGAGSRSYISPAFRLYTNYDGLGAHFGSTGVAASTSDATNTSVYAAIQGSSETQLTLVVLNKSSQAVQGTFALSSGAHYATARAWGFGQSSPTLVARPVPTLNANGDGFSYTVPALSATTIELTANSPLPVTLIEFTGLAQADDSNLLRWRTASEHKAAAFEVQRSPDGHEFRPVSRVLATNTATAHSYSMLDRNAPANPAGPSLYYRLRLLDLDGSATFSPVITLSRPTAAVPTITLAALPNPVPAGSPAQLAVQNTGPHQSAYLHLTDALGRMVLGKTVSLPAGSTVMQLPEAAVWPRGLYLLTLRSANGAVIRQKVAVE